MWPTGKDTGRDTSSGKQFMSIAIYIHIYYKYYEVDKQCAITLKSNVSYKVYVIFIF